jgi:hypothetical protein
LKNPFQQGDLDSLCGVYSLVNANRIVNKPNEDETQELFDKTILYLSKKRKLKETIVGGVWHKDMLQMMKDIIGDKFNWKLFGNGFSNLSEWWKLSQDFLASNSRSTIILSVGGEKNHLTVISSMTNKTMILFDSAQIRTIRKSACRLAGYPKDDKYVIYPSQSFLCWKD